SKNPNGVDSPLPGSTNHRRLVNPTSKEKKMKYVCFGYLDTTKWGAYSQGQQNDMIDACFTYDEVLKKNGQWAGGEGLGGPDSTRTLRYQNSKVVVTDGPFVESKEVLGG